jgi:hypothetical protein
MTPSKLTSLLGHQPDERDYTIAAHHEDLKVVRFAC